MHADPEVHDRNSAVTTAIAVIAATAVNDAVTTAIESSTDCDSFAGVHVGASQKHVRR